MKREYSIETNEGKIYPLGVTKTPGGFDVAFVSEKKPALLLFEKGSRKRMARLAFPENARMGNVHYMTVKGDFTGLEEAIAALETEIEKSASNYTRLNELMKEKTEKEAQLEEKMDRWMYLTDLVEQIESQK